MTGNNNLLNRFVCTPIMQDFFMYNRYNYLHVSGTTGIRIIIYTFQKGDIKCFFFASNVIVETQNQAISHL